MKLSVDTNGYRDFCDNEPKAVGMFRIAERIYLPFVVLAELRAGFAAGTRGRENERILNMFLGRSRVSLLFADEETTFQYARLFYQLREQGTPIPVHDIWIAALTVQHDLTLFTRDEHFSNLPQLPRM